MTSSGSLPSLSVALLLAFLLAACVSDWRSRRIPNPLVLLGLVSSWLMASAGLSQVSLLQALLGSVLGVALFLPLYALKMVGAGDAKLLSLVGGFVGAVAVAWIALYTLIAGGALALLMLLIFGGWRSTWARLSSLAQALFARLGGAPVPVIDSSTTIRLPYALAIAAGSLTWLLAGAIR